MNGLPLLSASQIAAFAGDDGSGKQACQRKWAFQYIERIERPQHPSAVLGTEVQDEQLDPWLLEGRSFDFSRPSGEIANALVPLLPKPKSPGMQLRRWFGAPPPPRKGKDELQVSESELEKRSMPSPSGLFGYRGEIDIYAPDSSIVPGFVWPTHAHLVGDIKTTSNLDYAKTKESLAVDVQAQLYAMEAMFHEGVDAVDLVWFYVRTRKPYRVQRTHLRVTASHVAEQFQRIDEIGRRIGDLKSKSPKAEDLPPNVRMCEAYGGCPYRHKCNLSPEVFASAHIESKEMSNGTSSFLDSLRKKVQPGAPAPSPAPAANAAPVTAPSPQPSPAPTPAPAAEPEKLPEWATAPVDPLYAKRAPINPPESALPPAPPMNAAPTPAPAAEPKKRGRPPKSEQASEASSGIALEDSPTIVAFMRDNGIKRLGFDGTNVREIEVA